MLGLLHIALCHASSLKDQIGKDGNVWKDDQRYDPDGLDPTRNIVATEQIGKNSNQQPEPHDEDEYPQDIHQKIAIGETFLKEEHLRSSFARLQPAAPQAILSAPANRPV